MDTTPPNLTLQGHHRQRSLCSYFYPSCACLLPFLLFSLPTEIRLLIYSFLLLPGQSLEASPSGITDTHTRPRPCPTTILCPHQYAPLLCISRLFTTEILPLLVRLPLGLSAATTQASLHRLPRRLLHAVRVVHVHHGFAHDILSLKLGDLKELRVFLQSEMPGGNTELEVPLVAQAFPHGRALMQRVARGLVASAAFVGMHPILSQGPWPLRVVVEARFRRWVPAIGPRVAEEMRVDVEMMPMRIARQYDTTIYLG